MAYIKLRSSNPNFSHVLQKNPATQEANGAPFSKNLTDGRTYLWFENPQEIILLYKHFENKKVEGFSYLDYSPYNSGTLLLRLLDAQLRTAFSKGHDLDTFPAEAEFSIYNHNGTDFSLHFDNKVEVIKNQNSNTVLKVKGSTVKETLSIIGVIAASNSLYDKDIYIDDPKYLRYVSLTAACTNSYHLLRKIVSFTKSPRLFEEAKDLLKDSLFDFKMGKSFDQRQAFFKDFLRTSYKNRPQTLLDLGCGEGNYFKISAKNYDNVIAIEMDPKPFDSAWHMSRKIQCQDQIEVQNQSIQQFLDSVEGQDMSNTDVLLTEVLEHMPVDVAGEILDRITTEVMPAHVVLTVPNKCFNIYYGLKDNEIRHDDHFWEPTYEEVVSLFSTCWNSPNYEYLITPLGDSLKTDDTISSSVGIVLTRKDLV